MTLTASSVQVLHWGMGGAALVCFGTVQASMSITLKSKGGTGVDSVVGWTKGKWMNLHKSTALLFAAMFPVRLGLRFASSVPAHLPGSMAEVYLGKASHAAMYGFMATMPATGIAMGYFGGKGLPFFGYTIPGAQGESKNGALAGNAFKIHKQAGLFFEYLFLLHLSAVGYHTIRGHGILARMGLGSPKA